MLPPALAIRYAEGIGRLAATAHCTLASGGARGIDQAAMRGALEAGGKVVGVLADRLERAVMSREHREVLMDGRLVLISPYDPAAGFNVGHAMQRNKLVYALVDAALVVSSDYQKGGTWAGAIEQLEKLRFVPVYVRSNDEREKGLESLRERGALRWPNPVTPDAFLEMLTTHISPSIQTPGQACAPLDPPGKTDDQTGNKRRGHPVLGVRVSARNAMNTPSPAEELFAKARELITRMETPKTEAEVAEELQVSKSQAGEWLRRLVHEGVMERLSRPTRYRSMSSLGPLFNGRGRN